MRPKPGRNSKNNMNANQVKRISVVKLRGMGDTILWAPALEALRNLFPQSSITAFCSEPWNELVSGYGAVDEAVGVKPRNTWDLVRKLRGARPDLVISFHATYRTALAGFLSGAPHRVVRNHSGPDYFSTLPVPGPKKARPAPLRDLEVIRAFETSFDETAYWAKVKTHPYLEVPEKARENFFEETGLSKDPKWIALCPGASRQTNIWSASRWADLALQLKEKGRKSILLVGPGEDLLASQIMEKGGPDKVRIGGSLWTTAAILEDCEICVAADSGPKHLAVSVGCPTLTIWGSSLIQEWHPYSHSDHPIVSAPVPCRPCFQSHCSHLSCLVGIETQAVVETLENLGI